MKKTTTFPQSISQITAPQKSAGFVGIFKCMMPIATLFLTLTASSAVVAQDLYLIIGQSNAAGRDTNIRPNNADAPDSNVKLFTDGNTFEIATQPLNRFSDVRNTNQNQGVNFGLSFAKKMHEDNGREVHLVVNARGGTRIGEWVAGDTLFESAVDRVIDAESACNCRLTGILWHQGEGNVNSVSGEFPDLYFTRLRQMIEAFRDQFDDVPFIVGEIRRSSNNRDFNRAIRTIDDGNFGADDVEWARSRGLDTFDNTHFDAPSMRALGRRYANRMQQFID